MTCGPASQTQPAVGDGGHVGYVVRADKPDSERPSSAHNCLMDLADFVTKWPEDKKTWCCDQKGIGCNVKYHKGNRVWFSRKFNDEDKAAQQVQQASHHVQILAGIAAACFLAVGTVLAFIRRGMLGGSIRDPSYSSFPAREATSESSHSASA